MENMKYNRAELLTALKANRDAHRKEFETALAGYEAEAIKQLQTMTRRLKAGQRPNIAIHMAVPQDHTKDYDRIIKMIEMNIESTIALSENEFAQYVQDDWQWKGQFTTTNSAYMAAGAAALSKKK